jgi:small subunit ribosomal protein S2
MALPDFSMRQLLEAGVHFGHQTHRWNPKMAPYIFGARNNIHIIDLSQTVPHLFRALEHVRSVVAGGGRVLFVGTKRQASNILADAAKRSGQYFVNHRWLGGMLTNWQTISKSIKLLKELDQQLSEDTTGLTKKELLQLTRRRDKLELSLGGIRDMGGVPDVLFVIDTNREEIAVAEAKKLGIPVIAVLDSNCDPDGIAFPVPGNDDATRSIQLYCDLIAGAVLDGLQEELSAAGVDLGAVEKPVGETAKQPQKKAAVAKKADAPAQAAPVEKASEKPDGDAVEKEQPEKESAEKAAAKKAAVKKASKAEDEKAEKKPSAKKIAAKKAPAKKPAKSDDGKAEKKPAATKAPAKTALGKKAPAKKATTKKAPVKKAAAKGKVVKTDIKEDK